MLLYLIRHGETDWNRGRRVMGLGPVPLNERGRARVEKLASNLCSEAVPVIYTSTVARAVETSRILSEVWGSVVHEEPRLNESSYERWVGRSYDELKSDPEFELYTKAPTRSNFSKDEGMADIQRRALDAVDRVAAEAGSGKAAVVSHSDVIKPVIAHYLGMDLDAMHRLSIANASVTLIDTGGLRPRLHYLNLSPWRWQR
ncbi:MAG: histidine phosphatase family protein [Candidatus Krumholzibacteria bacterium]|nr:histidine phosphatase family protein [Candidatus Krumholzibacteria bacterium]